LLQGFALHGAGFGEVKPTTIYLGGDPTGSVNQIVWQSWGGPQAEGTGLAWSVEAGQTVSQGHRVATKVLAFDLGTCDGHTSYRALEYLPPQAQGVQPAGVMNICDPFTGVHSTSGIEIHSPSGNINCQINSGPPYPQKLVFCFTGAPPQSVTLSESGTYATCTGAQCLANPAQPVELPYGQSVLLWPFRCTSAPEGMTCTANGKGFQISKSGITTAS
jgi:hypothetical protein